MIPKCDFSPLLTIFAIMPRRVWLIILLATASSSFAQVSFEKIPRQFSLIPRNLKNNRGDARFTGTVKGSYGKVNYSATQNGKNYIASSKTLVYSGGTAAFDISMLLPAGKFRYHLKLQFIGTDTVTFLISDVLVGDVYIIQGQSNAVANVYNGVANPTYADSFIRSFGTSSTNAAAVFSDTIWYKANGDGIYNKGCIGQWGLVMARHLLDSFGIPVAIMNGAVGGTSVTYHQRYDPQPDNINTCYGRLLYRMRKAGLDKNVRSILWYQGESDGPNPVLHDSMFRFLYADWFKDYKGMEQNYLVQVRGKGCGNPGAPMMEVQRQFEFTLPKVKVISSNGLNGHDGCHFAFNNGYRNLGEQLAALVSRDLYNSGRRTNIDPPGIASAIWYNAGRTEILLVMRQPDDSIFVDPGFTKLFYINGDTSVKITGGYVVNNRVVLQLNKGTCLPVSLTYLGQPQSQPWVKNRMGAGLVSFDKLSITNQPQVLSYTACPGEIRWLGSDSIPGCKYSWKKEPSNKTITSARLRHEFYGRDTYRLFVHYSTPGCLVDSFIIRTFTDETPRPHLGKDTVLCHGDSLRLSLTYPYASVKWTQNLIGAWGPYFVSADAGLVTVVVNSAQGCEYTDSLLLLTASPVVNLNAVMDVCPGEDTLIDAPQGFAKYEWNGTSSAAQIRAGKGLYVLQVWDSLGCDAGDSVLIREFDVQQPVALSMAICPYDSVKITRPAGMESWSLNGDTLPMNIFSDPDTLLFEGKDLHGCAITVQAEIRAKVLPVFHLGPDTGACSGQSVELICNYPAQVYRWNGNASGTPKYKTSGPGLYRCEVIHSNGCRFADSVFLVQYPSPVFELPQDTTICAGDTWAPALPANCSYWLNGVPADIVRLSIQGQYNITATNVRGCATEQQTFLTVKVCANGVNDWASEHLRIYPNPAADRVFIEPRSEFVQIYNISGQWLLSAKTLNGTFDIHTLPGGLYLLKTEHGHGWVLKE